MILHFYIKKKLSNKPDIQVTIKKIEEIAKVELKDYFRNRVIGKDEYKAIMKKIVNKVKIFHIYQCLSIGVFKILILFLKLVMGPEEDINLRKIKKMILYYLDKVKNKTNLVKSL